MFRDAQSARYIRAALEYVVYPACILHTPQDWASSGTDFSSWQQRL